MRDSTGNCHWSNVLNFSLGSPEISKIWALVAQIYFSGYNKLMGSLASEQFGPLQVWPVYFLTT